MFLLLCLPSGCGHPLGSLVSFVTIDCQRRFPLEVFFLLGGSLPTSSVGLSCLLLAADSIFP